MPDCAQDHQLRSYALRNGSLAQGSSTMRACRTEFTTLVRPDASVGFKVGIRQPIGMSSRLSLANRSLLACPSDALRPCMAPCRR